MDFVPVKVRFRTVGWKKPRMFSSTTNTWKLKTLVAVVVAALNPFVAVMTQLAAQVNKSPRTRVKDWGKTLEMINPPPVEPSEALLADFQTRLGYASKDVTPPARTAIDAFHQDLHRAAPQTAAGAPTADLLWHLVPRSRADKKRALS